MNWDAIGATGEVLGATVVVISVIYLATQIWQNTATSRAEALRSYSFEIARQFQDWGSNPEISKNFYKVYYGGAGRADFSPREMMMVSFSIISRFSLYDAAYRNFQEGLLTESEIKQLLTARLFDYQFTRESWSIYKQELSPDFSKCLERELPQLKSAENATSATWSVGIERHHRIRWVPW